MNLKQRAESLKSSSRPHLLCGWEREWLSQMADCTPISSGLHCITEKEKTMFQSRMRDSAVIGGPGMLDRVFLVLERNSISRKWMTPNNRGRLSETVFGRFRQYGAYGPTGFDGGW